MSANDSGNCALDTVEESYEKVFNDEVHGSITMTPLCVAIIDTPEFQRLRFLKQTGSTYFVYPAASHNRFEHSIGVSYLGGELVEKLRRDQIEEGLCSDRPELINDRDVLCVKVAGLCHDLGHGPFSHLWQIFMDRKCPEKHWKHEEASGQMLDYLLVKNGIDVREYGLDDRDVTFIKELILGQPLHDEHHSAWNFKGRDRHKSFLYDIIANDRTGVDVDKWDYFLRDANNLGITLTFQYKRLMMFCRVLLVDGEHRQICFRDKEVENLREMFETRSALHRKAYQHKTCLIIDEMLMDVFEKVDDVITLRNSHGKELSLSACVEDMSAYALLTDDVLQRVMRLNPGQFAAGTAARVQQAQTILNNLFRRRLYPLVGQTKHSTHDKLKESLFSAMLEELEQCSPEAGNVPEEPSCPRHQDSQACAQEARTGVLVCVSNLTYKEGLDNILTKIRYYSKRNPAQVLPVEKGDCAQQPSTSYQVVTRCYCPAVVSQLRRAFRAACDRLDLVPLVSGDCSLSPRHTGGAQARGTAPPPAPALTNGGAGDGDAALTTRAVGGNNCSL